MREKRPGAKENWAKRPGANRNRGDTIHGANGIRGETTRFIKHWQQYNKTITALCVGKHPDLSTLGVLFSPSG